MSNTMRILLLVCLILSLLGLIRAASTSDPNVWKNGKECKVKGDIGGRCMDFSYCTKGREFADNPSCGTGKFPDVCCESKQEDFVEITYGRVAKQECNRYMNNIEWKQYGYVLGGINARPKEFTFMAALGYGANVSNIKFLCGGSLISEKHVLTAAHCLYSPEDGPVRYVLLGDLDINNKTDDAQPQYCYVQNVTVHPEYKRSSVYHDIAILHLDRPARFTEWVQPACLDFGQLPVKTNLTSFYATGWGYVDTEGNRSSHMQEVDLIEYEFERCNKAFPVNKRRLAVGLVEAQMCAGAADPSIKKKDTCQGDSGGPLSRTNSDIRYEQYKGYIVVGITSFGKLCGFTYAPGVYTRVEKYIPWIESTVWPEQVALLGSSPQRLQGSLVVPQNSNPQQTQSNLNIVPSIPNPTMTNEHNKLASSQVLEVPPSVQPVPVPGNDHLQKPQVIVNVDVSVQVPQNGFFHTTSTKKPVNLIDVHYFSAKK